MPVSITLVAASLHGVGVARGEMNSCCCAHVVGSVLHGSMAMRKGNHVCVCEQGMSSLVSGVNHAR